MCPHRNTKGAKSLVISEGLVLQLQNCCLYKDSVKDGKLQAIRTDASWATICHERKELLVKENYQTNVLNPITELKMSASLDYRVGLQSRENYIHTQKWEISCLGRAKLSLGEWVDGCEFFFPEVLDESPKNSEKVLENV